jgi:hypothetical protein
VGRAHTCTCTCTCTLVVTRAEQRASNAASAATQFVEPLPSPCRSGLRVPWNEVYVAGAVSPWRPWLSDSMLQEQTLHAQIWSGLHWSYTWRVCTCGINGFRRNLGEEMTCTQLLLLIRSDACETLRCWGPGAPAVPRAPAKSSRLKVDALLIHLTRPQKVTRPGCTIATQGQLRIWIVWETKKIIGIIRFFSIVGFG